MSYIMETEVFGHKVYTDKKNKWRFSDTKELLDVKNLKRKCPKCNELPSENGNDPCISNLPGVKFACCGHGNVFYTYVSFDDGSTIYREEALEYIKNIKR